MTSSVQIKRVYEAPAKTDGLRVLVDRIWPRGLSKSALPHDMWCKDLAPSATLRTWFGHKPERWDDFQRDYAAELQAESARATIADIFSAAQGRAITLLYSARDTEHNQAVVLAAHMNAWARHHRTS